MNGETVLIRKNWKFVYTDREKAAEIAEEFCLDPFAALLLVSRGITENEDIEQFLFCSDITSDPYELCDMDRAVERLDRAIENYEKIMIFGDYDADGVTSTALLYLYLSKQGANVGYYIPDRASEGYGISKGAVEKFGRDGVKLIVTVDNGISAVEETLLAKELGIDVIITDHHKVGEKLPDAVAVINPHRQDCECPFKEYAGVGVALKLVCALEGDNDSVIAEYGDLAAIGTLADVVQITDENRVIVKKGLEKINRNPRKGIKALMETAGVSAKDMNAVCVSYSIAPRINAAGRMDSAMLAARLMITDSGDEAMDIAEKIESANRERQSVENEITQKAISIIEENDKIKYAPVIVVSGEGWHQGVIGIVASRLVSRYGKPAAVITTDGEEGKGSCRSIEGYSIYDALLYAGDMLTHFGGHTLAAGFGIKTSEIDAFREKLCAYKPSYEMPFLPLNIDFNIKPSFISNDLLETLSLFEPYGAGNARPCFSIKKAVLKAVKPVGEGRHLRLTVTKDNADITAMVFSVGLKEFPFETGDTVDIAFKVEKNEYRGETHPSVHIQDIRFSDFDFEKFNMSMRTYGKFRSNERLNEKEINLLKPDRTFFSGVYKFLKTKTGFPRDIEAFCHRSGCPYVRAATVQMSLDVMCELGLARYNDGCYSLIENAQKVELQSSEILKSLEIRRSL